MTQLKISEADAFRWIQKTAMDRRLSMKEVAEAVINGLPRTPTSSGPPGCAPGIPVRTDAPGQIEPLSLTRSSAVES